MSNRQVPLMLSVPRECRDTLRTMAAKRNLQNPAKVTAAASIARELVLEGIERIEQIAANLAPVQEQASEKKKTPTIGDMQNKYMKSQKL